MTSPVSKSSKSPAASSAASPVPRRPSAAAAAAASSPSPAGLFTTPPRHSHHRMVDDEAEEVPDEEEAEREGAESPTEFINTEAAAADMLRMLSIPTADAAHEAEKQKLMTAMRLFDNLNAAANAVGNYLSHRTNIAKIVLPGRAFVLQKSTSPEGVLEEELACQRSHSKQQQHLGIVLREVAMWKKDCVLQMEKEAKRAHSAVLLRLQKRTQAEREAEKAREQQEDLRRTLEGSNLVKKARLNMKVAAIRRELQLTPADEAAMDELLMDPLERAAKAASLPQLLRSESHQVLIESVGSESRSGAGPSSARLLEFLPSPAQSSQAAASTPSSSQRMPSKSQKKRRSADVSVAADEHDSVIPASPHRAGAAAGAAAGGDDEDPLERRPSNSQAAVAAAASSPASSTPSQHKKQRVADTTAAAAADDDDDDDDDNGNDNDGDDDEEEAVAHIGPYRDPRPRSPTAAPAAPRSAAPSSSGAATAASEEKEEEEEAPMEEVPASSAAAASMKDVLG